MRIRKLWIRNFRSCRDVEIDFRTAHVDSEGKHVVSGSVHALVGANNAGKSAILRALDFLLNPSTRKINEEAFWNKDTALRIRVEAHFGDLTAAESEKLGGYLRPDGTFLFARTAGVAGETDDDDASVQDVGDDLAISIGQEYRKPQPKYDWLVPGQINGKAIDTWWKNRQQLVVANGQSFGEFVGNTKPKVGDWKSKAQEFVEQHLGPADFDDAWEPNPRGFPNVLRAALPIFELMPAVRDVSDESKVQKTNPFGRLIGRIEETMDEGVRDELDNALRGTARRLNREGGDERLPQVIETEQKLAEFLKELMPADFEIEFQPPTLRTILGTPRILIDDGFRTSVENKGHGLQRAVIFCILRAYAELVAQRQEAERRVLILGIEEPELYMHPTAQRTIRRVLRAIGNAGDQVMFSTHAPLFVDVAFFDEIVRVEREPTSPPTPGVPAETTVTQLSMKRMIDDLVARHQKRAGTVTGESMRDRYSHAYTPTRNEGFFAKRVVLVEGQTESYSLPIYARSLEYDFDRLGVSVIECGGKDQINRLYRIFNELGIPCYVLFDYDKGSPDKDAVQASRDLVQFLGETMDEPEKAHVTERFACFAGTWESDLKAEIPDYDRLATDARRDLGLRGDRGKPLLARYVVTERVRTGQGWAR
jgi:predicted ATP-dependent endonuclease of OLD family